MSKFWLECWFFFFLNISLVGWNIGILFPLKTRERERGLCFKGLLCKAVLFFPHFVITLVVSDFSESKDEFRGVEWLER